MRLLRKGVAGAAQTAAPAALALVTLSMGRHTSHLLQVETSLCAAPCPAEAKWCNANPQLSKALSQVGLLLV